MEDDATWVKSTMERLENNFQKAEVKQIRMHCQCGYGMDEKLELVYSTKVVGFARILKEKYWILKCRNI